MSQHNVVLYILLMILIVNGIRMLPVVLIHGRIRNRFLRSFLYYVPYVTLAVMTFPAIIEATPSPLAGLAALLVGIILFNSSCFLFSCKYCPRKYSCC